MFNKIKEDNNYNVYHSYLFFPTKLWVSCPIQLSQFTQDSGELLQVWQHQLFFPVDFYEQLSKR